MPRAVLFGALITTASFGNLMLAKHPGTVSMGILLTVGLTMTLLCALVLLPSLRRRLNALADGAAASGWAGPHLVFFQHDEVIVHCPQAMAPAVVAAVGEAAEEAGRLLFGATPVRFPVTTAVVDCYADAK